MKKDWNWANQALKEVGRLEGKLQAIEDAYSNRISALQEEEQEKKKGLVTLRESLKGELERFVRSHRDDLPGETRRIKVLPSGRVGLTLYTQLEIPDPQRTIEAAKRRGWLSYIKTEETVDKTALQRLESEELKVLYVQRKDVERFFLEAKCPTSSSSR